jgi:DNA processing protein
MRSDSLKAQIALSLIPGLGAQRITRLIQHFNEPQRIFKSSLNELLRIDGIGNGSATEIVKFKSWNKVEEILNYAQKNQVWLLSYADPNYPERLKHIYDPPVLLWGKGNIHALSATGIAIIGTRKPSVYGKEMAEKFSKELTAHGLTVISGLAYGIDTIAHRACVETNSTTVAVLGSGIDRIYPSSNLKLAQRIVETGGAVISEFPPGTKPDAGNFPVRNRIVSGLSLGVLVIESGLTGGSMITANLALDQGREVFAVPHEISKKNGEGGNALIKRSNAKLISSIDDILSELQISGYIGQVSKAEPKWLQATLTEEEALICKHLGEDAVQIDTLAEHLGKAGHFLLGPLLQLELKGMIKALPGKYFKVV